MLEKRVKSGLAVTPRHLKLCDDNLRRAGVGSRNGFVEQAIEFYCSHLMSRELSMLGGRSQVPMERFESLCRSLGTGQYKLSAQVPDSEIRAIQTDCAQEVKRLGRAPTFLQSSRRERDGLMADDSALLPGRRPGGRRSHVKANDNFLLTMPYLSGYSASKSVLCVAKEGGGTHERLHESTASAVLPRA